jgi:hypothetical protein
MKKIVASVGLAALGASTLQTVSGQELTAQGPKPWSVSGTLRGFYDDNINSASNKTNSFGVEISPAVTFAFSTEQTTLNLGYVYSAKWYDTEQVGADSHWDQQHVFNAALIHAFNEKDQISVSDSFVIGQEPDVLRAGNTFSTFQFVPGYNIRNYGVITLDGKVSRQIGYEVGYDNTYFRYADDAFGVDNLGILDTAPSLAGLLNRIENGVHAEGRWEFNPETFGVLGFRFRQIGYTADQPIATTVNSAGVTENLNSDVRDAKLYAPYIGAIHTFTPELSASVNVGANYADYYNDPSTSSQWSPYVNLSVKYNYGPESYVSAGFSQDRNATDIATVANGKITQDQESSVVFATVNHRITPKIYGNLTGQFQNSVFNGGTVDGDAEQYYLVGLDLEYRFTPCFSAHAGYNYDKLVAPSVLAQSFDRNRVYVGVTASY